MKQSKNPTHNCPCLGKDAIVCKAFNTSEPDKIYYKCPLCGYTVNKPNEK